METFTQHCANMESIKMNEYYEQQIRENERIKLLTWLAVKNYLTEVYVDEDEDFDGNRTYETIVRYLDVDQVLDEYKEEQKNE